MKMITLELKKQHKTNYLLFALMILLLAIGCIFVHSASFYQTQLSYGDKFFFLKKQLFGIGVGLICYFVFSRFDYNKFEKFKFWLLGISFVLLIAVFVPGIGLTNYGSTRWINLRFITFQPSEIAKFAFIIFSASYLSKVLKK